MPFGPTGSESESESESESRRAPFALLYINIFLFVSANDVLNRIVSWERCIAVGEWWWWGGEIKAEALSSHRKGTGGRGIAGIRFSR